MTEQRWLETFAANLKEMIEEFGYTQKEVAWEAGLSEAAISNYVNARRIPSMRAIVNLAQVLDVSVDELVNFDDYID